MMSSITDEEREMALETGTFEGASLEGYYVPVSVEVASAGTFRLVFSEHGKEFTAEGDNSNLAQKFLRAHREFHLEQMLSDRTKPIS
jgi:hypothetical protein